MTPQVFQVDTKGICVLCLCTSGSASEAAPVNSISATGFKMFLRYLKIDILDLLGHVSSSLRPDLNGPSDAVDVSVILCQRCSLVTGQFLQLFQQYEKVRLELDNCAQKLHQAIREGQEDGNRIREYRKRLGTRGTNHISPEEALNVNIAERLREKTMEKCALRLASSTPKILTTKITFPPHTYSSGPATTSDKVIKKKSSHKSVFTDVEPVSREIGGNFSKEEIDDSGDIASPSLTVTEEPAVVVKIESVFDTEWDNVILQPTKPGTSKYAVSVNVRTPLPPEQVKTTPDTGISGEVMTHSNIKAEFLHPSSETVELVALPIYVQPVLPIMDGAQAYCSSNNPEFSQNHETQVMDSLNKEGIIDMDFEGDSDNDVPSNDPLDFESDPATVQSQFSSSFLRGSSDNYFKPIQLPNGKLKCPQCRKVLGSWGTFRQHQRELHITKKAFRCQHCDNTFPRKRALVKHIKVVHTFLEFSERFPVGTTEIQFVEVVNDLLRQVRESCAMYNGTPQRAISSGHCTFCEKVVALCKGNWREHIFCCHIDQIVGNLQKSKHNWLNSNINAQKVDCTGVTSTPPIQSPLASAHVLSN